MGSVASTEQEATSNFRGGERYREMVLFRSWPWRIVVRKPELGDQCAWYVGSCGPEFHPRLASS